uniref:Uncharacterized protein n=1 Tax=Tanacetum cinerariifolium TaxID=118510 RepID=A0A6L2MC88_TANCI|nr:hypothetical protein [Tanacetum cinerariifolium]
MCKAYTVEDFGTTINELGSKRPDVYEKLIEVCVERWSRAYCPRDRYNYMTSNSAGSINNLIKDVKKVPITNLMQWYRKLVQRWYCKRREKYKAICKVIGLTNCNRLAKGWFMRIALKGTYQELVYPVGKVSSWQVSNYLPVVKPPYTDKQPSGRPKSTKRIRSQGEEPVIVRCERCGAHGHNRQGCRETISYTKERTYPRGSLQQADDYLPQSMSWSIIAYNKSN